MISVLLKPSIKNFFFDRGIVMRESDRGRTKALSRIGAFVMTASRRSIRKRKRPSVAGEPPSAHTGDLKKGPGSIVFGYDTGAKSVVVGPRPLNKLFLSGGKPQRGTVPQVLEEGGRIGVIEQSFDGANWFRMDLRRSRRGDVRRRIRTITIAARPFMKPALKSETANPKLKAAFSKVINNG